MDGAAFREWRRSQDLTQKQVAELLSDATGLKIDAGWGIGAWERGKAPIPKRVLDYLQNGGAVAAFPPEPDAGVSSGPPPASGEDVPPGTPSNATPLGLALHGGQYAQACEDLWDMFGFTLNACGTAFGKPALRNDGLIICGWEDQSGKHPGMKHDLGAAYGKLAERNRTFQRIVVALSQESVWAEVCIVTSKLAIEMYRNHERYRLIELDQRRQEREAREREQQAA